VKAVIEFEFAPGDHVYVIAYGLQYRGRVMICEARFNRPTYVVEYVDDGAKITTGTFWGDQLRDRPVGPDEVR
jgi:hypothetical protein